MEVIHKIADIRKCIEAYKAAGQTVAFVPTMGALHEGHLSLVRAAKVACDKVVVSIFVNPTQFGPNEDFSKYPRVEEADKKLLLTEAADIVFMPTVEEMYPGGFSTRVVVGNIGSILCGAHRPGHFDGVATIVSKLLLQVMPHKAFFGEKDYQQLTIIKRLVQDLNIPVDIIGYPTVREVDGLAMSSRNRYLSEPERKVAAGLNAVLLEVQSKLATSPVAEALAWGKQELLAKGFTKVDYLEMREEGSLDTAAALTQPSRLLAAAFLGTTRLIDNIQVMP